MGKRGMSQALALIIAATVLMMAALITIFIVQGGLEDTDNSLDSSGCLQVLEAQCPNNGKKVRVPSTCEGSSRISKSPGQKISCGSW